MFNDLYFNSYYRLFNWSKFKTVQLSNYHSRKIADWSLHALFRLNPPRYVVIRRTSWHFPWKNPCKFRKHARLIPKFSILFIVMTRPHTKAAKEYLKLIAITTVHTTLVAALERLSQTNSNRDSWIIYSSFFFFETRSRFD